MSDGRYDRWTCAACGRPNPFYSSMCLGWKCHELRPHPPPRGHVEPTPEAAPATIPATRAGPPVVPTKKVDPVASGPDPRPGPRGAEPPLRSDAERAAANAAARWFLDKVGDIGEGPA